MVYLLMQWAPGQFRVVGIYRTPDEAMAGAGYGADWWEPTQNTHGHREWRCTVSVGNGSLWFIQEWVVR